MTPTRTYQQQVASPWRHARALSSNGAHGRVTVALHTGHARMVCSRMVAGSKQPVPWSQVWDLYVSHASVFADVIGQLRARGTSISSDEAAELVHSFLVDHAPSALATFEPERGELRPWLWVVFRRYVIGTLRSEHRHAGILTTLTLESTSGDDEAVEATEDLDRVRRIVETAPRAQRDALKSFFGAEGGSVRAVARSMNVSRREARRILLEATARIVLALRVDVGASWDDVRALVNGGDDTSKGRAVRARTSTKDQREAAERVSGILSRLLSIDPPDKSKRPS